MCKTRKKIKMDEINFNKFIWFTGKMKYIYIYIYIYILVVFLVAGMKKKMLKSRD